MDSTKDENMDSRRYVMKVNDMFGFLTDGVPGGLDQG